MTGRLEQALRLKSHGFFLPGRHRQGGAAATAAGGRSPTGVGGRSPTPGSAQQGAAGTAWNRFPGGQKRRFLGAVPLNLILKG